MKKKILFIALFAMLLIPSMAFAKTYEVPVDMMHYGKAGEKSMGTNAINHMATVEENNGSFTYKLQYKPMEFMNLTGQLTNLFIYDGDINSNRVEASVKAINENGYNKEFSFTRNNKDSKILVAVWVDAMDQLSGGEAGSGAGEQKAYLVLDWDAAKETNAGGGALDKIADKKEPKENLDKKTDKAPKGNLDKIADKKDDAKKNEIKIVVNGKEIKPEVAPFVKDNRTLVPVRFISEALGLKVDWDAKTKTVIVGEGKDEVKLVINTKEITKADGTKTTIDSAAIIKDNRTFVPLRAIAEIAGAKVDWDGATRTVSINK